MFVIDTKVFIITLTKPGVTINEGYYLACDRCGKQKGYPSLQELQELQKALGLPGATPVWVRVLWPKEPTAYPRYLVESSGRIIAIQEPGCAFWHIRTPEDKAPSVNDNRPPSDGEFDTRIDGKDGAFNFDTADGPNN